MFDDKYFIPQTEAQFELRERGSRFFAYIKRVEKLEEIKIWLQGIKQMYPDATHHCLGYVLGTNREVQFSSDDGEPQGSAGKPILRKILSSGLTNCAVVVVRYFGGTQLGIPGLIKAYGDAAEGVLTHCGRKEVPILIEFNLECSFEQEGELQRNITKLNGTVISRNYLEVLALRAGIPRSNANLFDQFLKNNTHLFRKK